MRYGSIYLITNKINNKKYVGQTTLSVQSRWKSHITTPSNSCIHSAIKKYGQENFIFEELCSATNKQDLDYLEAFFIDKYETAKNSGYNKTFGGDSSKGLFTDEVRMKMRLAKLGKKRGSYKKRSIIQANQNGSFEFKKSEHVQRLEGEPVSTEYNPSTSPQQPSKYVSLKEKIIALYNEGYSSYAIAEKFDLDKSHVCRYLQTWNVLRNMSKAASLRNKKRYKLEEKLVTQIKDLKNNNVSVTDISKTLNVSRKVVYRALAA